MRVFFREGIDLEDADGHVGLMKTIFRHLTTDNAPNNRWERDHRPQLEIHVVFALLPQAPCQGRQFSLVVGFCELLQGVVNKTFGPFLRELRLAVGIRWPLSVCTRFCRGDLRLCIRRLCWRGACQRCLRQCCLCNPFFCGRHLFRRRLCHRGVSQRRYRGRDVCGLNDGRKGCPRGHLFVGFRCAGRDRVGINKNCAQRAVSVMFQRLGGAALERPAHRRGRPRYRPKTYACAYLNLERKRT
mmetsp:Transcript_82405/g.229585  ORF Transcript_82405/g.229585 Transcript_82405/m.229585 type:complete len:243 (+) Transcript_82405:152-880(+)